MIEFPRGVAKELRAVFRRSAWVGCGRGSLPPVQFQAVIRHDWKPDSVQLEKISRR